MKFKMKKKKLKNRKISHRVISILLTTTTYNITVLLYHLLRMHFQILL